MRDFEDDKSSKERERLNQIEIIIDCDQSERISFKRMKKKKLSRVSSRIYIKKKKPENSYMFIYTNIYNLINLKYLNIYTYIYIYIYIYI